MKSVLIETNPKGIKGCKSTPIIHPSTTTGRYRIQVHVPKFYANTYHWWLSIRPYTPSYKHPYGRYRKTLHIRKEKHFLESGII
jgi:hypothetical protein